jgi:D-glycero-alpha-D-manno-heptose-7-phosphate kinase
MQKELAVAMKDALLRGQLTAFGELLGTAWEYKKLMSPKITTPMIDEAYAEAIAHGAIGGKITGAGGGGFMLFYCRPGERHRVADRLSLMGLQETEFAFEPEGMRTWTYVEG